MGDFLERNVMSCHVLVFLRKQYHPCFGVERLRTSTWNEKELILPAGFIESRCHLWWHLPLKPTLQGQERSQLSLEGTPAGFVVAPEPCSPLPHGETQGQVLPNKTDVNTTIREQRNSPKALAAGHLAVSRPHTGAWFLLSRSPSFCVYLS